MFECGDPHVASECPCKRIESANAVTTVHDAKEDLKNAPNARNLLNEWDSPSQEINDVTVGAMQVMFGHTINISNTENLFLNVRPLVIVVK